MATLSDVSAAIESALIEIGINGRLTIRMEGSQAIGWLGCPTGDDHQVTVTVSPLPEADRNEDG